MNKRGFSISIPQMIRGIIALFIAILGARIFSPMIFTILGMIWQNTMAFQMVRILVWLIFFFIIYVIVYGTLKGGTPDLLGMKGGNEK